MILSGILFHRFKHPDPFLLPMGIEGFRPEIDERRLPSRIDVDFISIFSLIPLFLQIYGMIPDRNMFVSFLAHDRIHVETFDMDHVSSEWNEAEKTETIGSGASDGPDRIIRL